MRGPPPVGTVVTLTRAMGAATAAAVQETERSFARPAGPEWRAEPFRLFFPLAVLLGWVGVGHWLTYGLGLTATYSCLFHGLVQMQAFMMAFAAGFLLTAIPRRTGTAAPSSVELTIAAAAPVITVAAGAAERWVVAELAYVVLFGVLLVFAIRRFLTARARRPPAAFVLIPLGVAHGLAGAALLIATALGAPPWTTALGRLCVEQGVFLCFVVGVGSLILPLMAGAPPPPDLDASPRARRAAAAYASAGLAIAATLVLEACGWSRAAPIARALVVGVGIACGGGAWRPPGKPGLHRRLVWLAVWLMPLGLVAAGLVPDFRVAALHVLFIGGFGLLAFGVATHVALGHLGLESLALGRPRPIAVLGVTFVLAMLARVAADFSDTYFDHLAWAAAMWLVGSTVWLAFLGPRLLGRARAPSPRAS
jgi:uncharacterized protein involved in response to NO